MSKIAEQLQKAVDEKGASKTVPPSHMRALLLGAGRVEYLIKAAEEYGFELRLERKSKRRENADGISNT
jgi:hypothetical protein